MTQAKTHRRSKIITSTAAIIAVALSVTLLLSTTVATIPDSYINNEWNHIKMKVSLMIMLMISKLHYHHR